MHSIKIEAVPNNINAILEVHVGNAFIIIPRSTEYYSQEGHLPRSAECCSEEGYTNTQGQF